MRLRDNYVSTVLALATLTVYSAMAQQAPQLPAPPQPPRTHSAGAAVPSTPYMGVGIMDIDPAKAKSLKMKEERGAEITSLVAGGPAEKAGLKVGDVVLEYDGQHVQGMEQLQRLVRESVPGHALKVGVWRNGALQTVDVTIELHRDTVVGVLVPHGVWSVDGQDNWPFSAPMPFPVEIPRMLTIMQSPILGVDCEALGDEQQFAEFFGVKDGLLVKKITSGSPAQRAGVKAGDVIVKVEDTHVGTMRELTAALRAASQKGTFQITVVRNKKEMQISVTPEGWHGAVITPSAARQG